MLLTTTLRRVRTHLRSLTLSFWVVPDGMEITIAHKGNGVIDVLLEFEGTWRATTFGARGWISWAAFAELDSLAASMSLEAAENEARTRKLNATIRAKAMRDEERRFASECGEGCRNAAGARVRHGLGPVAG